MMTMDMVSVLLLFGSLTEIKWVTLIKYIKLYSDHNMVILAALRVVF